MSSLGCSNTSYFTSLLRMFGDFFNPLLLCSTLLSNPWHKLSEDNEMYLVSVYFVCFQMLGMLKQLVYLDVSKNNLEMVDEQICGCESLQDLLLSNNALTQLPGSIGKDYRTHPSY